jgi:hypothetical protein
MTNGEIVTLALIVSFLTLIWAIFGEGGKQ